MMDMAADDAVDAVPVRLRGQRPLELDDLARLREAIRAPKRELAGRRNVEEDLQRLIPGATLMSCSGFATAVIRHMDD